MKVFAPFKKCPENLLVADKLKWIMRVKEIEINKINHHQLIDIHLKVNLQEIQWMVKFLLLKVMDYQVVTEYHLQ